MEGYSASERRRRQVGPASPGISPRTATPMSPGRKLELCRSKVVQNLEKLKEILEGIVAGDEQALEIETLHRREKREAEFKVRFARNHLYPLRRCIVDVKELTIQGEVPVLGLVQAYQTAQSALHAYLGYTVAVQSAAIPDKIQEVLALLRQLDICSWESAISSMSTNDAEYLQGLCKDICSLLLALKTTEKEQEIAEPPKPNKTKTKTKKTSKFEMYEPKDDGWKTKSATLARTKFGIPKGKSKKTTNREDERAKTICEIYSQRFDADYGKYFGNKFIKYDPGKLFHRRDLRVEKKFQPRETKAGKLAPMAVKSKDYDVETAVQNIADIADDTETCRGHSAAREDVLDKAGLRDALLAAVTSLQGEDKVARTAAINNLLASIQAQTETRPNAKLIEIKSADMYEPQETEGNQQQETQNGTQEGKGKREEEDIVETYEQQRQEEMQKTRPRRVRGVVFRPHRQEQEQGGRGHIYLSAKNCEQVLEYKRQFREKVKDDVLYNKSAMGTPWKIVDRMTERIVDIIIQEVAQGIADSNILQQLYYGELTDNYC